MHNNVYVQHCEWQFLYLLWSVLIIIFKYKWMILFLKPVFTSIEAWCESSQCCSWWSLSLCRWRWMFWGRLWRKAALLWTWICLCLLCILPYIQLDRTSAAFCTSTLQPRPRYHLITSTAFYRLSEQNNDLTIRLNIIITFHVFGFTCHKSLIYPSTYPYLFI